MKTGQRDRLLRRAVSDAAHLAGTISDLETRKQAIEEQLGELRTVHAELMRAADALNRDRLERTSDESPHRGPNPHLRLVRHLT